MKPIPVITETTEATPAITAKGITALGYPSLLLGVAVLLSTSLLAVGHLATQDDIALRQAEDLNASLSQVLPAELHDNDLLQSPLDISVDAGPIVRVYRAEQQQRISAVAYQVNAPDGYGGTIEMIIGVDSQGQILGVRVLSHSETPGLGDKIEIARSDWILGFDGQSLNSPDDAGWAVKKDGGQFDQFTGATVTPRAVVKAVKQGLLFYRQQQARLLAPRASVSQPSIHSSNSNPASTIDGEST